MPNPAFFKEAFDRVAVDGAIGDPRGIEANGYLRVSSDQQANEGRTGLPRQIQHVHETGVREGYRIPWNRIYADDESGFTLDRPALNQLLEDLKDLSAPRVIIIEHLDRLSRNADWHQGYLLHLFETKYGAKPVFWKQFGSRVERMVMGAISQDGMERSKSLMSDGRVMKAKSGRVTAGPRAAYGYYKVDQHGQRSEKTPTDTHYAIDESKVPIITFIYEALAFDGKTLYAIGAELDKRYPPPGNFKGWAIPFLWSLVRNPVYKGKFAAYRNRVEIIERTDPVTGVVKKIRKNVERPESEWIYVDVPAIVSEPVWRTANEVMIKNRQAAKRNAKHDYLLSGLIWCDVCGRAWIGQTNRHLWEQRRTGREYKPYHYYKCGSKSLNIGYGRKVCGAENIRQDILENSVWAVIKSMIERPKIWTDFLDEKYSGLENQRLLDRITYLRGEITAAERADQKALDLYNIDGYTAQEYAEKHKEYQARIAQHKSDIQTVEKKFVTAEQIEAQKRFILDMMSRARKFTRDEDIPFELKRNMIRVICDKILINQPKGEFTVEGEINGTWPILVEKLVRGGGNGSGKGAENSVGNRDGGDIASASARPVS